MNISANHTNLIDQDTETWHHLKQVIASSSGFDKWQRSRNSDGSKFEETGTLGKSVPDDLVINYLRETLETLAY